MEYYNDNQTFVKLFSNLPMQIEQAEQAKLSGQSDQAKKILSGAFWIPLLIQVFMSGAMSHVWNIMNTLQIINTFPLYSLKIPENVIQMSLAFATFSNLEVIPKDKVYKWFIEYFTDPPEVTETPEEQIDGKEAEEEAAEEETGSQKLTKKEETYKQFGMDTNKVVQGAMQLLVGMVALVVIFALIKFLDVYIMPKCFKKVKE